MRAYKTVRDVLIEPVSFIVPRRVLPLFDFFANYTQSEVFQEDIYPDTLSGEPSQSSDDWFSGRNVPPQLLKMELVYRSGADGHLSRPRDFVPLDSSGSESKGASQSNMMAIPVSTIKPISQKPSSTDIESQSTVDIKNPPVVEVAKLLPTLGPHSSSEGELLTGPTKSDQETLTRSSVTEPGSQPPDAHSKVISYFG
jgi:hypothetical protein